MLEYERAIQAEVPSDDSADIGEQVLLYSLIRSLRPKTVVEIGTHKGKTALYMAHALYDNGVGHLYTYDPVEWQQQDTINKFPELSKITTVFRTEGKNVSQQEIDFVFIDGFHEKQTVIEEFDALNPRLSEHAVIVFHDCDYPGNDLCDPNGAIESLGLKTIWLPTKNRVRVYEHSQI